MNLLEKKSGQATLIIVMVTLAAVVGVAATSSTQTSFSLKNTVYGVQSEQALACAEAGAEKILGQYRDNDDPIPGGSSTLPTGTLTGSECKYDVTISDYPDDTGLFSVPRLNENSTIQLKITASLSGAKIDKLTLLNASTGNTDGQIAVYIYDAAQFAPRVSRRMIHCGSGSAPQDFESASFSGDSCSGISLGPLNPQTIVRIRALNNDIRLDFSGFTNGGNGVPVGHFIESTGKAGTVERKVTVYRFYRQLPDFFDEAVAVLN